MDLEQQHPRNWAFHRELAEDPGTRRALGLVAKMLRALAMHQRARLPSWKSRGQPFPATARVKQQERTLAHPTRGSWKRRGRLFQKELAPKHKRFSLQPIIQKKVFKPFLRQQFKPSCPYRSAIWFCFVRRDLLSAVNAFVPGLRGQQALPPAVLPSHRGSRGDRKPE